MELPELGKRCALPECHQLDFLPFECSHCRLVFCKQHFMPAGHGCAVVISSPQKSGNAPAASKQYHCSHGECAATSPVEMTCVVCRRHFCVQHRHHGCVDREQADRDRERDKWEAPQRRFRAAKEEADRQVDEGLTRARRKSGLSRTAVKVQLMRLKGKAAGAKTVPTADRVYFLVLPPLASKRPGRPVFVARQWSFGRAIDAVADACDVVNRNNHPDAPKLRLFSPSDGSLVCRDLDKKLDDLLKEEAVVDGETLILEYVSSGSDAEVHCLENVELYKS